MYFLYNHTVYPSTIPVLTPMDRGFTLGDGVFETIKINTAKPELWDVHIKRLFKGCDVFNLNQPNINQLYDDALLLIEKNNMINGVLKIIISRQSPVRGLGFNQCFDTNITLTLSELPPVPVSIKAIISEIKRNETSPLSRIKSLNYGDNMLAFNQARMAGYDDALMLNQHNQPCCFTIGNIVIQTAQGELITPPVDSGCLEGTFLTTLKNVKYQNFNLADAVKIWRSNSLSGLVPVLLDCSTGLYSLEETPYNPL
jgi:branched-chain amino acid aminotransferase